MFHPYQLNIKNQKVINLIFNSIPFLNIILKLDTENEKRVTNLNPVLSF